MIKPILQKLKKKRKHKTPISHLPEPIAKVEREEPSPVPPVADPKPEPVLTTWERIKRWWYGSVR